MCDTQDTRHLAELIRNAIQAADRDRHHLVAAMLTEALEALLNHKACGERRHGTDHGGR